MGDIILSDGKIVDLEEARQAAEASKAARTPGNLNDFVTRREMLQILDKVITGVGDASAAVGEQVYEAVAEETQKHLQEMHTEILNHVGAKFERRTFRGRLRALRGYLIELGVIRPPLSPALFDPALFGPPTHDDVTAALDPNVQAESDRAALASLDAGEP